MYFGYVSRFFLSSLLHYTTDAGRCLISTLLVLSADGKDSVTLAMTRIKANVLGATVGVICLLFFPANGWLITSAITLSFCYLFKPDARICSAIAAPIIIMLHEEGKHVWDTAIERVIAVFVGCISALVITFIFHFKSKTNNKLNSSQEA